MEPRKDITRGPKQVTHKRFNVIQKLKKYMAISCLPIYVGAQIGVLQKVIYMFSRNNWAQWSFSCFTEFSKFSGKHICTYSKRVKLVISCVRDQDATTAPAIYV